MCAYMYADVYIMLFLIFGAKKFNTSTTTLVQCLPASHPLRCTLHCGSRNCGTLIDSLLQLRLDDPEQKPSSHFSALACI